MRILTKWILCICAIVISFTLFASCVPPSQEIIKKREEAKRQRQESVKQGEENKRSSIVTIGTGRTKEDAIQDALRKAVERSMGVYIYSTTEVNNFQLVKDKIIASSRGYVNNYEIVKEDQTGGLFFLTLNVVVNVKSIESIVRKDVKFMTYGDALKDYALVKQRMDRIRKAEEIVAALIERPVHEAYNADFAGYEIKSVRRDMILIELAVKLTPNPFYWNTYSDIINHLSEDCKNTDVRQVARIDGRDLCLHVDTASLLVAPFKWFQIFGWFSNKESFLFYPLDSNYKWDIKAFTSYGLAYWGDIDGNHGNVREFHRLDGVRTLRGGGNFKFERDGGILKKTIKTDNPEIIKDLGKLKFFVVAGQKYIKDGKVLNKFYGKRFTNATNEVHIVQFDDVIIRTKWGGTGPWGDDAPHGYPEER